MGGDRIPVDLFFSNHRGGDPAVRLADSETYEQFLTHLAGYQPVAEIRMLDRPCSMLIEEVESIWAAIAERDDWQPLYDKVEAIRRMGAILSAN